MLQSQFIEEMKQKLLEAKKHTEGELAIEKPHTEMGDDEEANSDEVNVDEASQDVMAIMKSNLEKINKALAKIEDGTYGIDDEGKEISEARLRALPWADKAL